MKTKTPLLFALSLLLFAAPVALGDQKQKFARNLIKYNAGNFVSSIHVVPDQPYLAFVMVNNWNGYTAGQKRQLADALWSVWAETYGDEGRAQLRLMDHAGRDAGWVRPTLSGPTKITIK